MRCCTLILALSLGVVAGLSVSPANGEVSAILWTGPGAPLGEIKRTSLGTVQNIASGFYQPWGIAIDVSAGKVYWTDPQGGTPNGDIWRANLDGSCLELLQQNLVFPNGIALDVVGGKMYWVQHEGLVRANLDGTAVENLVVNPVGMLAIALDVDNGLMYWSEGNNFGNRINRANMEIPQGETAENRTDIEQVISTPSKANGIALDAAGGKVYWTVAGGVDSRIMRANLNGSGEEVLLSGEFNCPQCTGNPGGITLDLAGGKMYWEESAGIRRANLDGTSPEDLLSSVGSVVGIAILPAPNPIRGDMDDNGVVNGIDTQLFVAKLLLGCP